MNDSHDPKTLAIISEILRLAAMVKNPQNVPIIVNLSKLQKLRYQLRSDGTYYTRKKIFQVK